jgi:hypothetical protein
MLLIICFILRRALFRDFQRLPEVDEENNNPVLEDIGWKLVRIEAMMVPHSRLVFAAMIGAGMQFLIIAMVEMGLGWFGLYYGHKGTIKTTGIITYAFTGCKNHSFTL